MNRFQDWPAYLTADLRDTLLRAPGPLQFMSLLVKPASPLPKALSYAELARKAGLASRAHAREVLLGKRPLTSNALPKLIRALALTGDWREYFLLLTFRELPALSPERRNPEQAEKQLIKLRAQIRKRKVVPVSAGSRPELGIDEILEIQNVPRIFAALGRPAEGATLEEISRRSALSPLELRPTLNLLAAAGWIEARGTGAEERFASKDLHMAITDAGRSRVFLAFYLEALEQAKKQALADMKSAEKLFLTSSFSVRSERLPELKKELQTLLHQFIDRAEDATGDRVVDLTTCLS